MIIESTLKLFNLSHKEICLYQAMVRLGPSSAAQIAKEAELPRQTVYSLIDKLIGLEIIEQSDSRGIKRFTADLYHLETLLKKRQDLFFQTGKLLEKEIPKILTTHNQTRELPRVQYYQGKEGLKRLFEGMLTVYKKGKHKTFRGYGLSRPYPGLENYIMEWIRERYKLGIDAQVFVPKNVDFSSIGGGENTLGRKFKLLDIDEQPAALYLVGNRVYLFSYKDNVGVMIDNQSIAELMKVIFDNHWEKAK